MRLLHLQTTARYVCFPFYKFYYIDLLVFFKIEIYE